MPELPVPDALTMVLKGFMCLGPKGIDFTQLFEQAAMTLMREIPVLATARF